MKYVLFILLFSTLIQDSKTEYCDDLIAKGIDALYNKEHTKSLELLSEAKTLAQTSDWYEQLFISTNCIGLNYYQMLDYGEALDNYLEAYTIAIKNLTPEREMTVLNNIALVYLQEGKFKESEKHQKRAFEIALAAKDTIKIGMYSGNLASLYFETKQFDEASKYIDLAKSLNITDIRVLMQVYNIEAESYIAKKDYKNAQKIIELMQGQLHLTEFNDNKIAVYIMLSKIYESENKLDEAIKITQKARSENLTFNNSINIYNRLSTLFNLKGEHNKSLTYKDSVIIAKDSLNAIKNQILYQNSKIKLELQDYQRELNISEEKLHNEKRIRYYLIGFTILVISLLGWLSRSNYIKYKQKRIIAERSQKIIALELKNKENDNLLLEKQIQEKETLSLLEKEKLKNELEAKNRKLAANALNLANRNEKIETFILNLNKDSDLAKNKYLTKQLSQLKNLMAKENDLSEFLIHFEEINSHFINTLKEKHPELNTNDIRYICYIYMNLTTKEISSLFNITIEAARKRKERISKKMNLIDSNELYDYLSAI